MEYIGRAPLRRRQEGSTASTAASSQSSQSGQSSARSSSITASASLPGASASPTASTSTGSASASGSLSSSNSVYTAVDPPAHTATSRGPYAAPGVNATHSATSSTSSHSTSLSSSTRSSASSSTTTTYKSPAESQMAAAKAFGIPSNQLTACEMGSDPKNGPVCSPIYQQSLYVGLTYAITWNPDLMARNATNVASLDYSDKSLGNAWKSKSVPNILGYIDVEMSNDWLNGATGNSTQNGRNLTLNILSTPFGGEEKSIPGPEVLLVVDPKLVPLPPVKHIPNKYGLEIGLPVGIVAIVLILIGVCCGIRKNNKHHRSIRGVSHDYMAKRARKRGKNADVALEDLGTDGYHDQPVSGGTGNAFRDEIAKQRAEDDASVRRMPSSY